MLIFLLSTHAKNNGSKLYGLPKNKIISFGYPKNDALYDKKKSEYLYKNRSIIKMLFPNMNVTSSTVILYTPTWRAYKSDIPLINIEGFTEKKFSDLLEDKNILFVYSLHPINRPNILLKKKRSSYIYNDTMLIDINNLMHETDILMNDYSTTSIDYCLTEKPQIFCLPDHNKYKNYVDLDKDFLESLPGDHFSNFDELASMLDKIVELKNKIPTKI